MGVIVATPVSRKFFTTKGAIDIKRPTRYRVTTCLTILKGMVSIGRLQNTSKGKKGVNITQFDRTLIKRPITIPKNKILAIDVLLPIYSATETLFITSIKSQIIRENKNRDREVF